MRFGERIRPTANFTQFDPTKSLPTCRREPVLCEQGRERTAQHWRLPGVSVRPQTCDRPLKRDDDELLLLSEPGACSGSATKFVSSQRRFGEKIFLAQGPGDLSNENFSKAAFGPPSSFAQGLWSINCRDIDFFTSFAD